MATRTVEPPTRRGFLRRAIALALAPAASTSPWIRSKVAIVCRYSPIICRDLPASVWVSKKLLRESASALDKRLTELFSETLKHYAEKL